MALPAKHRLPLRHKRLQIESEGTVSRTRDFTVVKHFDPLLSHPRLGIIISRKTLSLSVSRHQLKRKIIGALSPHLSTLPVADFLIIPRHSSIHLSVEDISHQLLSVLK